MKKNNSKQSTNVKNQLNNNNKISNKNNNVCNKNNNKVTNSNNIGFEDESHSFTLDENDDHSFELR